MLTTLEGEIMQRHRRGDGPAPPADDARSWIPFVVGAALEAGRRIRGIRLEPLLADTEFKRDGSPATRHERHLEEALRSRLAEVAPEAVLVGEETGGSISARGVAVTVDPVDGTWSLLGRTATLGFTLTVIRDGEPELGLVSCPAVGELAWGGPEVPARLLQLDLYGEGDRAEGLPLQRCTPDVVLLNLHPSRRADRLARVLFDAWQRDELGLLRMAGGSPAMALLEVAKGSHSYLNLWTETPSHPWDLAAAALVVRAAGGEVVDLDGRPIPLLGHRGPFLAASQPGVLEILLRLAGTVAAG